MIRQDALFKGCTRPAMKWGIPIIPLGISLFAFMLLGLYTSVLIGMLPAVLIWCSYVPVFLVMQHMVRNDDQAFRLLYLKFRCRMKPFFSGSLKFWRSAAYAPLALKARKS